MNMNLDDPKLTAYALDELDEPEKSTVARAVSDSPEAQQFVNETREMAGMLKSQFAVDLEKEEHVPSNLLDIRDDPWFWKIARPLSIAAILAVFAVIGLLAIGTYKLGNDAPIGHRYTLNHQDDSAGRVASSPTDSPFADIQVEEPAAPPAVIAQATPLSALAPTIAELKGEVRRADGLAKAKTLMAPGRSKKFPAGTVAAGNYAAMPAPPPTEFDRKESYEGIRAPNGEFNTAAYDHILENPFLDSASNPLSTFSIDVDTASYSNVRRFINEGSLPPKDAVRVEEMINYFTYDYPQPTNDKPFSINIDATGCPWEPAHRLVRIGLKGREIAQDKRGASNLVFLLDVSGSMTPADRLPLVKQAMRLLVDKLTENDRVAIVVYAGASGLALPSTGGDHKEQILSALENLQPGGSTNGAEGIQLAYKTAADNFIKGGVNRVILATDGDFNVGVTSQGDLIRLIEEKAKTGVFLSVLGVGTNNLKDSTMQKLADKGNGNYAYLDSLDEARKVLVQQMNGTLVTIAKDVKIQVEFNPARVASYRLIGYEKRILRKEDFNNDKIDAGEIGAGHTVTALYEIVPAGAAVNPAASVPPVDPLKYSKNEHVKSASHNEAAAASSETMTVKLRFKKPDGDKSQLIARAFSDDGKEFANASPDLKFAAAVAEFGMVLRESEHKGNGTLGAVLEWAQEGKGGDAQGYRAGFIELVRKAQSLNKG
jgi:Ca-activated chloride channel family protein